jgi:hypothetical protein
MSETPSPKPEITIEGVEDYHSFNSREELEQFAVHHGITADGPKAILYAFKKVRTSYDWEDKHHRYFTQPCSVGELLERLAEINTYFSDKINDFSVGIVFMLPDKKQLAIRYQIEETELTKLESGSSQHTELLNPEEEREVENIYRYEAALCQDHHKLFWDGTTLLEN